MKTRLIGEYKQADGWHPAHIFASREEAKRWIARVDESGGHHHARRYRRVKANSAAEIAAYERCMIHYICDADHNPTDL